MKHLITILFSIAALQVLHAQKVAILNSESKESFRGLSVVNDSILWVSGTHGTVGRSLDAGKTFQWMTVQGFEQFDFRDIEAFDENTALIMGISEPAYILKTKDAGQSWQVVYENPSQGMFLDAMDFYDNQNGMVIGDPLDGKIFLARTNDAGDSWNQIDTKNYPTLSKGEACFASSGSNIVMLNKRKFAYITGGIQSNLYIGKKKIKLPIIQGKESTGANSLAVKSSSTWMVVGGDFLQKEEQIEHAVVTTNAGKSFSKPIEPPHGYRSCVQFINVKTWISCGLNGVDITTDDGLHWQKISSEGFHVCQKARNGNAVYFAGQGKIGVYRE
jgi:hypothetical protein